MIVPMPPALPIRVHCDGCGLRWTQTEAWEHGTLLRCGCGEAALLDNDSSPELVAAL